MPDNHRAAAARIALDAFSVLYGQSVSTEAAITDLLCNLLHLAHAEGLDPKALVSRAKRYYQREVRSPDHERPPPGGRTFGPSSRPNVPNRS